MKQGPPPNTGFDVFDKLYPGNSSTAIYKSHQVIALIIMLNQSLRQLVTVNVSELTGFFFDQLSSVFFDRVVESIKLIAPEDTVDSRSSWSKLFELLADFLEAVGLYYRSVV